MKLLPLLLPALLFAGTANAQISFGPEVGVNASTYFVAGTHYANTITPGIRAGLKAEMQLHKQLYLQTGILYVSNGYAPDAHFAGGSLPVFNIHTIEIPAHFLYRFKGTRIAAPYIGAGPYLGINAGGAVFIPGGEPGPYMQKPDVTRPIKIGSSASDDIKMLDAGISATAGLQMTKGLCLAVLCQRGMINLQPVPNIPGFKAFNLGFSASYFLHHKPAAKKITEEKK